MSHRRLRSFWSPNSRQVACLAPARPENGDLSIDTMFAVEQRVYIALRVADVRTGSSRFVTVSPPTQGYARNVLPFFDQYQRSATMWSPNSRRLTFSATTSRDFPGVFVAAASGRFRPVFSGPGDLPFWSRRYPSPALEGAASALTSTGWAATSAPSPVGTGAGVPGASPLPLGAGS